MLTMWLLLPYVFAAVIFGQSSYSVSDLEEEPESGRDYTSISSYLYYVLPGVVITELTALDTDRSGDIIFSVGDDNFDGGIIVFANKTSDNNLLYDVKLLVGPNVTRSTFDYDVSTVVLSSAICLPYLRRDKEL